MPLRLLLINEPAEAVEVNALPVVLGRSGDADIRVDCRWASRRHCEIDQLDGQFILRDLGSRYGTMVNGSPVRQIVLHHGDEIGVGLSRFVVHGARQLVGIANASATGCESEAT